MWLWYFKTSSSKSLQFIYVELLVSIQRFGILELIRLKELAYLANFFVCGYGISKCLVQRVFHLFTELLVSIQCFGNITKIITGTTAWL